MQEVTGLALGGPPGLTGFAGGRPKPSPVIRLFSFTQPKAGLDIRIGLDDRQWTHHAPACPAVFDSGANRPSAGTRAGEDALDFVEVPLIRLALARSGDKGDKANIGVIARRPEFLPWIWAALTEDAVAEPLHISWTASRQRRGTVLPAGQPRDEFPAARRPRRRRRRQPAQRPAGQDAMPRCCLATRSGSTRN